MSWLGALLGKLVPGLVVDATTRLVQAARESLRPKPVELAPPPPIGESGAREASAYLDGANDADWRRAERERLNRSAEDLAAKVAADDAGPAEEPSDDDSAGGTP